MKSGADLFEGVGGVYFEFVGGGQCDFGLLGGLEESEEVFVGVIGLECVNGVDDLETGEVVELDAIHPLRGLV